MLLVCWSRSPVPGRPRAEFPAAAYGHTRTDTVALRTSIMSFVSMEPEGPGDAKGPVTKGGGGPTGHRWSNNAIRPRRRKRRRIPPTASPADVQEADDGNNDVGGGEGRCNREPLQDVPLSSAVGKAGSAKSKRRRKTTSTVCNDDVDISPKHPRRSAFDPMLLKTAPGLLRAREMGAISNIVGKRRRLQQQQLLHGCHPGGWFKTLMLCQSPPETTGPNSSRHPRRRWEWKPHVHRSIPFRVLGTPSTDAVLALSRDASYTIALGGGAGNITVAATSRKGKLPMLVLRFYGLPSPARQRQHGGIRSGGRDGPISPLLLTIPLLFDTAESAENRNLTAPSALLGESAGHAAANTPVRMLFSRDGCVAVAVVLHSTSATEASPALPNAALVGSPAVQDEDALGTVFVFPLPGSTDRFSRRGVACKSWKCSNVRVIGNLRAHSFRNLMWPTRSVPVPASAHAVIDSSESGWCNGFSMTSSNGYLLLNDEDDGYRMTWLFESPTRAHQVVPSTTSLAITAARSDIICKPDYAVWDCVWSDRLTGCICPPPDGDKESKEEEGIQVKYEAYFSIEALLSDIMARREKMFASCSSLPDYFYNLISVSEDGRLITLVLVFATIGKANDVSGLKKKRTPAAIGLFLRYDIFSNTYDELAWVQHPTLSDGKFLRNWSNTLALNWRMREKQIGVFSLPRDASKGAPALQNQASKAIRFHDDDSRGDELDDFDPLIWVSHVEGDHQERSSLHVPPKDIAMSSLYPFCDVVTNKAVISAEPVMKIGCRDAPIELSYS